MAAAGSPPGPSKPLTIALDEQGHCQDAPCTWAPPPLHTHSTNHMQPLSDAQVAPNSATSESFTMESPVAEHFPLLYALPRRSSNSYEQACKLHDEPEVCHANYSEEAPQQDEIKPLKPQRTNSWEDQKRVLHMRFIYGELKETKTF